MVAVALVCCAAQAQVSPPLSDFDDGTLQGWSPVEPFGGELQISRTGGNPGGFIFAIDSVAGGGGLAVEAPAEFTGDLAPFAGVQWDEFLFPSMPAPILGTFVVLRGANGTVYETSRDPGPAGIWRTKEALFDDPEAWTLTSGSAPLAEVRQNLASLRISMDVSTGGEPRESGVDNIKLLPELEPELNVTASRLSFSFAQPARAATQRLLISNAGGGPLTFQVGVSTQSGEPWLSVLPLGGEVTPTAPVALEVTADPTGLPAGTYLGETIILSPANGAAETTCRTCHIDPVSMAISDRQELLRLSQKGLAFTAVSGGGTVPGQSFRVLNGGLGSMDWDTLTSTLSGGNWLSVMPTSGTSDAVMSPAVQVTVDPTALEPGAYYGVVEVTAPEAAGSPQFVTVVLNLLPAESNPGPLVIPTGLVFSSSFGGPAQALAQQIQIFNLTSTPLSFTSSVSTSDGADWFGLSPSEGTVVSSQPTTIDFGVDPVGLAPGIYRGATTFSFDDDSTRTVNLVLAVAPNGRLTLKAFQRRQNGCARSEVAPVFQLLGGTAPIPAGWPAAIEVAVVDDCGDPMAAGSAVVDFTNISSPSLALASSGDGLWTATWNVPSVEQQSMAGVTVTVTDPGGISASLTQAVSVAPNPTPAPSVNQGGIVHGASFVQDPLGPGTIVSIFGQNLSTEPISAGQAALGLPLPTELAGTEISLGGRRLPLLFSREDQVNAIVPFELTDRLNESLPLLVRRTDAQSVSVSEPVFVMAARPGVFTQSQSGIGPGAIQNVNFQTVTQANPVKAGDAIIIYCAGLGEVDPPVASGTAAPSSPLAETAEQVTVTIAGLPAQVLFAGLTPSFASLYQVNAVVPQGVAQGEVEVTVSLAGQTSSLVTVAVE